MQSLKTIAAVLLLSGSISPALAEECARLGATQFVEGITYCVNSALKSQRGISYGPKNLFDGDNRTAWCEGMRGNGIGARVTLSIKKGSAFRRLVVMNGYGKSPTAFSRNARLRTVLIRTNPGHEFKVKLKDSAQTQYINLPRPAEYTHVSLTVLSVYPGERFEDACVSFLMPDMEYEEFLSYQKTNAGQKPNTKPVKAPSAQAPVVPQKTPAAESEDVPELEAD